MQYNNSTLSSVSYQFIAASTLLAAKGALYRLESSQPLPELMGVSVNRYSEAGAGVGVHPGDALGRFYETDLALGLTESANNIVITDAVCSVSQTKNIVRTALVGMRGTIKESISAGDYEITMKVGLVAMENGKIVDKYPAEGVRQLRALMDQEQALYVDSEFLRLFDITRVVVTSYRINQDTYSNHQIVTINCVSDEDYIINSNAY